MSRAAPFTLHFVFLFCLIRVRIQLLFIFFFFNDTATTEIYTLSLHDALPICLVRARGAARDRPRRGGLAGRGLPYRSEEHTSELQSHLNLVCRLLLEKKKKKHYKTHNKTKTKQSVIIEL